MKPSRPTASWSRVSRCAWSVDAQERDRDGRLLAYVYVADRMVNAELVRRGSAEVMTVQPNVRHRDLFVTLEQEARDNRRGVWADPAEATTPTAVEPTVRQVAEGRRGVPPRKCLGVSGAAADQGAADLLHGRRSMRLPRTGRRALRHNEGRAMLRHRRGRAAGRLRRLAAVGLTLVSPPSCTCSPRPASFARLERARRPTASRR